MNTTEQESALNNIGKIRLYTAIASLLLSVFAFYTDDIINRDGILYINIAEAYLYGGLSTKVIYDWPFYPILIAYTHLVSHISLETCATILNTLLFVLLTDTLVLISRKLVATEVQLIFSSVLILCFYILGEYRDFIIRDVGYWAFSSIALYHFMIFSEESRLQNAIFWLFSAITATLFRVEGIVFLLLLPLFLVGNKQHPYLLKKLFFIILFLSLSILIIALSVQPGIETTANTFSKIQKAYIYIDINQLLSTFNKNTQVLQTYTLNQYSSKYAGIILLSGLFGMLLYKLIKALSLSYLALYLLSLWQQRERHLTFTLRSLLIYFISINIAILVVFVFKKYFVATRYMVLALIGILLLILPVISKSFEDAWINRKYKTIFFFGMLMFINIIDITTQSASKHYIKDTATWASKHIPTDSLVLTDDEFIYYYFRQSQNRASLCVGKIINMNNFVKLPNKRLKDSVTCPEVKNDDFSRYDYLITVEKKSNLPLKELLKTLPLRRVYHLQNKRGDGASVYQVNR